MKKISALILLLMLCLSSLAQRSKKNETPETIATDSLSVRIAGMKHFPGYLEFYYDEKQDKLFLIIDKFDTELLYIISLPAGIGSNDIGLDRGQLGGERIIKFERKGPKVFMTQPNYNFRAVTSNADERRAVEEAFAQSVLWGFVITAEAPGKVLVDATEFFIRDAYNVAGTLKDHQQGSYELDKTRSAFYTPRTRNFPQNTEVEVTITLTGQATGDYIQSVTPSPNSVTVRQHHSFVQLPDNQYEPRAFDPRAGYFGISYFDYATPISEPIVKRFICRHRLKKKDPAAERSEAVEPIVYYLDRGTPEPIRSALLDGARWWNQAFEAAGYFNAFRVELMPEDADPMDVRYNVIQWVHRSTRGWSYGAAVIDPRTGEILKGHVTLGSLRVRQDYLIAEGLLAPYADGTSVPPAMQEMALARLRQLSAHEVGHTLGLAHSYTSSAEQLASVMDYPQPYARIVNGSLDLSNAYDDKIGAWDKVAIAYGYQDFPDRASEATAGEKLLREAISNGLTFLSDQDARPQGGAHPFAHLWDNGTEAARELDRMMEVRSIALKQFGERNIREDMPLATLEETLVPIYFYHRYQAEATVKLIGGLDYRYALRGDGQFAVNYIPAQQQWAAFDALMKTVSPEALAVPKPLIKLIPPHPMGYERSREVMKGRTDLTFDPVSYAEAASDMTFGLLLHPARVTRLVQQHALDASQPSLESVLDKMIAETFKAKYRTGYEGLLQMTAKLSLLHKLFELALNEEASEQARAVVKFRIVQLKIWLGSKGMSTNEELLAHHAWINDLINRFETKPEEFKPAKSVQPPPGQPIGLNEFCEW